MSVPRLKLLEYQAGFLQTGDSNWSRRGCEVEFIAPVRDEQNKKLESLEVKV